MARWLLLGVLVCCACGGGRSPDDVDSKRLAELDRVVGWSLGAGHRYYPSGDGDAYLLLVRAGAKAPREKPKAGACVAATALLAAPGPDAPDRVLLVIGGHLHVQLGAAFAPRPLAGTLPGPIARLLAASSRSDRLDVLVTIRSPVNHLEALWLVSVEGQRIVVTAAAAADPRLATEPQFFAAFEQSRCRSAGERCLVVSSAYGDSYVDVEPRRGKPRSALVKLAGLGVLDASWASDQDVYLLIAC